MLKKAAISKSRSFSTELRRSYIDCALECRLATLSNRGTVNCCFGKCLVYLLVLCNDKPLVKMHWILQLSERCVIGDEWKRVIFPEKRINSLVAMGERMISLPFENECARALCQTREKWQPLVLCILA